MHDLKAMMKANEKVLGKIIENNYGAAIDC